MTTTTASPTVLWHYTARLTTHLGEILRTGYLKLDDIDDPVRDLGFPSCVWFSSDQHFEVTASKLPWVKGPDPDGIKIAARIGVEERSVEVMTWETWYRQTLATARFRRRREQITNVFRKLTEIAVEAGSDVTKWRASPAIVQSHLWKAVEVYIDGTWVPLDPQNDSHRLRNTIPLADGRQLKVGFSERTGDAMARLLPASA